MKALARVVAMNPVLYTFLVNAKTMTSSGTFRARTTNVTVRPSGGLIDFIAANVNETGSYKKMHGYIRDFTGSKITNSVMRGVFLKNSALQFLLGPSTRRASRLTPHRVPSEKFVPSASPAADPTRAPRGSPKLLPPQNQ
jgi:hypothetical protein